MDTGERHVLDAVPVGLQVLEALGDDPRSLTLRHANEEANLQAGFDLSAREILAVLHGAIGVATFPADGGNTADLLAHADRAMHVAKGARSLR